MMSAKYPKSMRFFHHSIGLLIIILLAVGLYMSDLDKTDPNKMTLYTMHKTVGWLTLLLVLTRIFNRLMQKPAFIALPQPIQLFANLGHAGLYILMIVMPMSGWLMSSSAGYPVKLFGLDALQVPDLIEKNKALKELFKEVHEIAAWLLIALLVVHLFAAIYHKTRHDGVWDRMWK